MLSQLQNQVPSNYTYNRSERVQTFKKKKKREEERLGRDTGRENTSSHGLWFRIVQNALCLWSGVSRGHGRLRLCPRLRPCPCHRLCLFHRLLLGPRLRLPDPCPWIGSASLSSETCGGCGNKGGAIVISRLDLLKCVNAKNVLVKCSYPFLRRP